LFLTCAIASLITGKGFVMEIKYIATTFAAHASFTGIKCLMVIKISL